mmetsp:Transcript_59299/g.129878  ORF Transcript_59299/g.129878 Transcript_59299/m.129878 type:complete len:202 (+) Transcript_59299:1598-2203(+)
MGTLRCERMKAAPDARTCDCLRLVEFVEIGMASATLRVGAPPMLLSSRIVPAFVDLRVTASHENVVPTVVVNWRSSPVSGSVDRTAVADSSNQAHPWVSLDRYCMGGAILNVEARPESPALNFADSGSVGLKSLGQLKVEDPVHVPGTLRLEEPCPRLEQGDLLPRQTPKHIANNVSSLSHIPVVSLPLRGLRGGLPCFAR